MKNINFLKSLIAHRGIHDNTRIPENSIPAFKSAIDKGLVIELDVHLTKDNKVVVFHDGTLKRMCGVDKRIENLTYNELLKYNLSGTKYKIPLLKDVLKLVNGKVGLLIETKNFKFNTSLERELISLLEGYQGKVAIQSFNIKSLWYIKRHSKYPIGILSSDFKTMKMNSLEKSILKTLICDIFLKSDFISYDIRALPNIYVLSKRKKKTVIAWTIKDKARYLKAKD